MTDATPREYRCPVCSHVDEVELQGRQELRVRCTHCAAPLEVELRSPDEERLAVRLADEGER